MPSLDCDGVKLHYEDDGAGPAVLLTHGFGASTGMWQGQVTVFANRYRLIRWDMRGHGGSGCPDDAALYSQPRTVDDIAAILNHLGIDKAVIGGHSLGGFMALAFHARYPERVQALFLQGCGPGYRNPEARAQWNERAESRARTLEAGGLAVLGGGAEVKVSQHGTAQGLANAARGMLSQVDATVIDSLPGISVPTLIIIGDADTPYLQGADYMANRIPGAEHIVVPGAGHGVNVEKPDVVNAALEAFLARAT